MMTWFEWLGAWNESLGFGFAVITALLGLECLVLARKSYRRSRRVPEEGAMLGAEFGVFSAPGAQLNSEPTVPRNCYALAVAGVVSLTASAILLGFAFL
ncbi:MAG: hypothetical protein ACPGSC_07785 [Granulosicoccaceae bacterium]